MKTMMKKKTMMMIVTITQITRKKNKDLLVNWGKKKHNFYKSGTEEEEDYKHFDNNELKSAKLEESEAIRIQREKLLRMSANDFGDSIADLIEEKNLSKKQKKLLSDVDIKALADFNDELNDIDLDGSAKLVGIESSSAAHLSEEDRLALIEKNSPELLGLLAEFDEISADLRETFHPLFLVVQENKTVCEKPLRDYIILKYQLLLAYTTNLSFYVLLKSSGQQVQDHPIISQLVTLRSQLDKIQEFETNFVDEINSLLENYQQFLTGNPIESETFEISQSKNQKKRERSKEKRKNRQKR